MSQGGALSSSGGGSVSPLTTKGDLYTYSTANTRLPVGANGEVLSADSTQATGLKWAAVAGTGDVTAAANLTDNAVIRGDGGAKGVQDSGLIIDDIDNLSGVATINMNTGSSLQINGTSVLNATTLGANVVSSSLTSVGTIGTGVWNGTAVTVAYGGTGATSLSDGFVLLGSGTGAITALDVTAKGSLLVGDGTTDPVALAVGTNDFVLTADSTQASGLKWAAASAGNTTREIFFDPGQLQALETNFAVLEQLSGTTIKCIVRAFDDTTEEYVNGKFQVPGNSDTGGTVTFRAYVMAKTAAASKNIGLTFGHYAVNNSEDFDGTYTEEDSGAIAIDATQDDVTEATWTETFTNLGWAANDLVYFRLSRDVAVADDLTGDMYLHSFCIEIPRAV